MRGEIISRANLTKAEPSPARASGAMSAKAIRVNAGLSGTGTSLTTASGSTIRSVQRNSDRSSHGRTSKTPSPRTSVPVWVRTQRLGGVHSVIIMVSVNPTGPNPVRAVTIEPRP